LGCRLSFANLEVQVKELEAAGARAANQLAASFFGDNAWPVAAMPAPTNVARIPNPIFLTPLSIALLDRPEDSLKPMNRRYTPANRAMPPIVVAESRGLGSRPTRWFDVFDMLCSSIH